MTDVVSFLGAALAAKAARDEEMADDSLFSPTPRKLSF